MTNDKCPRPAPAARRADADSPPSPGQFLLYGRSVEGGLNPVERGFFPGNQEHFHHIEPPWDVPRSWQHPQPCRRTADDQFLFVEGHCRRRPAKGGGRAGLHFHKGQHLVMSADHIHFPAPAVLLGIKSIRVERLISLNRRMLPQNLQFVKRMVAKRSATTLAEHLRKRRLTLGLSQKALAKKLGTTYYSVSKWEHGKAGMRQSHRQRVVAWLGFDPELPQKGAFQLAAGI